MVRIFTQSWRHLSLGLLTLLVACKPAPPPTQSSVFSTATPLPAWEEVFPGLTWREVRVVLSNGFEERISLFRIDPALNRFRVLYSPAQPEFVSAWDNTARLVFNAAFFDENNAALGLLVTDGQMFGQSYVDFGGMFQVSSDGTAQVRSLVAEPYQLGETFEQAVQGFPMLLRPDGTLYTDVGDERARRTVIGQDVAGNILLVVVPHETFTLAEMATWLASDPELKLEVALNLDGGSSTGYYAGPNNIVPSYVRLPAVVAVYGP
jgi:hypothetical protein